MHSNQMEGASIWRRKEKKKEKKEVKTEPQSRQRDRTHEWKWVRSAALTFCVVRIQADAFPNARSLRSWDGALPTQTTRPFFPFVPSYTFSHWHRSTKRFIFVLYVDIWLYLKTGSFYKSPICTELEEDWEYLIFDRMSISLVKSPVVCVPGFRSCLSTLLTWILRKAKTSV